MISFKRGDRVACTRAFLQSIQDIHSGHMRGTVIGTAEHPREGYPAIIQLHWDNTPEEDRFSTLETNLINVKDLHKELN